MPRTMDPQKRERVRDAEVERLKSRIAVLQESNRSLKVRIGVLENKCERAQEEIRSWVDQATALRLFKGDHERRREELRRPRSAAP